MKKTRKSKKLRSREKRWQRMPPKHGYWRGEFDPPRCQTPREKGGGGGRKRAWEERDKETKQKEGRRKKGRESLPRKPIGKKNPHKADPKGEKKLEKKHDKKKTVGWIMTPRKTGEDE